VWPNAPSALSGDLQGGGGSGRVNNITYDTMIIDNVDYAIETDQCYGQSNITLFNQFPSKSTISNILFKNSQSKTSKKYSPQIRAFPYSSSSICSGIVASSINVMSPNGSKVSYWQNVDPSTLDETCRSKRKGFN
jgi:galacturan 1,4-alpha-galacturonidase